MEMESAEWVECANAIQATLVMHVRNSAQICAAVRASALMADACALEASLVQTARLKHVAADMETATSLANVFATQGG